MSQSSLSKISFWSLTAIVSGNLIGSGVFSLPSSLAPYGYMSLFGWIITSIGALVLALMFANLSRRVPKTGGPHVYVQEAFGVRASTLIAWTYWVLSWISNGALAVATVGYLTSFTGPLSPFMTLFLEALIVIFAGCVNLMKVSAVGWFKTILTVIKFIPLIILPVVALFYVDISVFETYNASLDLPVMKSLYAVCFLTLWGFIGVESATVPSGEVDQPQKTIPRATIAGTLIAAFVYILGTVSMMGILTSSNLVQSKAPYADMASVLFGGQWGHVIALFAIAACVSTLCGWTLIVSRIASGASEEGLFPSYFKKINNHGVPVRAVLISSACSLIFLPFSLSSGLIDQFNTIIDISIMAIFWVYTACAASYCYILLKKGAQKGEILLALASVAFLVWFFWISDVVLVFTSIVMVLSGFPFYWYCSRKRLGSHATMTKN